MREVSPTELLEQLQEMVEVLAAPVLVQTSWLTAREYPVDELWLQFFDSVPGWLPRLTDAGVVTPNAVGALNDLSRHLVTLTESQNPAVFTREGLATANVWEQVRAAAQTALVQMAPSRR